MPVRHVALAVLIAAIWGFNFVVIKVGVTGVPPILLATLRFLFAAIPLVFFVARPPRAQWLWIGLYGLTLGTIKYSLVFSGMKLGMAAGVTSIVMQSQAFFTIIFAAFLLRDTPNPRQIFGGTIAMAGLALIGVSRWTGAEFMPFLLVLSGAVAWAVANIISKKAGKVDALSFIVWSSLVATGPLFVVSMLIEGPGTIQAAFEKMSLLSLGAILFLAYPSTIVGFGLWSWLLVRYPASTVAPFSLLVPVFGIASAAICLGETIDQWEAFGGVLILAGLAVTVFGHRIASARLATASSD